MADIIARGMAASAKAAAEQAISKVDAFGSGITYKGEVSYVKDLPVSAEDGDGYNVKYKGEEGEEEDGTLYVWGTTGGVSGWIKQEKRNITADMIVQIGTAGQTTPTSTLLPGGLFFERK